MIRVLKFKKTISTIAKSNALGHTLFWGLILLYYINVAWPYEPDKAYLIERTFLKVSTQALFTYFFLQLLIPYLYKKGRKLTCLLSTIIALYSAYTLFVALRCFYLLPKYPEVYSYRPPLIFLERIVDYYAFLGNIPDFILPVAVLGAFAFYKKEQQLAKLLELQRGNELNTLKNQLNPHFLFNTLNNLYTLTLIKSEQAPETIEKLSKILDYTLYQCKSNVVPLKNELGLLRNYIDLEKLRYGQRVEVEFKAHAIEEVNIAPLILLTFVENAFKHGVVQETKRAKIKIQLSTSQKEIHFKIYNTKPVSNEMASKNNNTSIGLTNIKRQLDILYKNRYQLTLDDKDKSFCATLKIDTHDV